MDNKKFKSDNSKIDNQSKTHIIKCPYCFKTFNHDDVHFRVSQSTVERAETLLAKETDEKKQEFINKFVRLKEIDNKYYKIWDKSKGGDAPESDQNRFYFPYISKANVKNMTKSGNFDIDKDTGMVVGIHDGLENSNFPSKTRICPHCHNYLPGNYGKHEQIFISILGVSSSGKTIFIKQLMQKVEASGKEGILSHIKANKDSLIRPKDDDQMIVKGEPLPEATDNLNFKIPYFLQITFENGEGQYITRDIVIYDIAGENLIIDQGNPDSVNKFDFFAGFIKESDAIISLIDPNQLITNTLISNKYSAQSMIETLKNVFEGANKISIPTAITISKSDMLRDDEFIRKELLKRNIDINTYKLIFEDINWDNKKRYFYIDKHLQINGKIRNLLTDLVPELISNVRNNFESKKTGYFAISSLVNGVEQRLKFIIKPKEPSIIDINFLNNLCIKFPFLETEISSIINMLKLEEQGKENIIAREDIYFVKEFILDSRDYLKLDKILGQYSGQLMTEYAIQQEVLKYYTNIDEEIVLHNLNNGEYRLTVKNFMNYLLIKNIEDEDFDFNMEIIGYPSSTGNLESRRLEEPLFWIFSQLNLIEANNFYNYDNQTNRTLNKKNGFLNFLSFFSRGK